MMWSSMIYRGVRNRADGAQSKKSYGWADNMSKVDFGSWITNDFEKWITLKVAIPGQKVLTGQGDLPPTFPDEPEWMRESKVWPLPPGASLIRDLRTWHAGIATSRPSIGLLYLLG